ncbi:helix-turn-helix domain-containing protein [Flavobacterium aciduliphilum]|uniref:Helix-turn-helix protein n=1 Tax=Flavobacterium aciduliphilum TaxID=1101402 RepID=A0A328YPB3_9FLAO|nr:helix-turn-helix transcriptional regulator [Flavobacterium aciduliphilum]RAR75430.1 helix-turn-helix protein [Flavobacterium aciduliphilum]
MKDLLKNGRENKKITTRELALLTKIDQALISKFENGQRIPTELQIKVLASILEIDLNTLLVAWYKQKLLNRIDFNPQSIQAITEILNEKGITLTQSQKEVQIAAILSEIDTLKNKLSTL